MEDLNSKSVLEGLVRDGCEMKGCHCKVDEEGKVHCSDNIPVIMCDFELQVFEPLTVVNRLIVWDSFLFLFLFFDSE